jgi:hypothetical protein
MKRCLIVFGPPIYFPLRESFLAQPKALRIIDKKFDRGTGSISEDEQCTAEWVLFKLITTQGNKRIQPLPEIARLYSNKNLHLWQ